MSKEFKVCDICKKDIKNDESYYLLQSYRDGHYIGKVLYHWNCFNEHTKGIKEIEYIKKETKEVLKNLKKMMEFIDG